MACILSEQEGFTRQKLLDKARFYLFAALLTHLVLVRQWHLSPLAPATSVTHFSFSLSHFLPWLCNFCTASFTFSPWNDSVPVRQFQNSLLFHQWNNKSWHQVFWFDNFMRLEGDRVHTSESLLWKDSADAGRHIGKLSPAAIRNIRITGPSCHKDCAFVSSYLQRV